MDDNILVAVRVRPLIAREKEKNEQKLWEVKSGKYISSASRESIPSKVFCFDRVFDTEESTVKIYNDVCLPIIKSTIKGFNGTIFAYGQTSSGKTYTMMGEYDKKFKNEKHKGIIEYCVEDIFNLIQGVVDARAGPGTKCVNKNKPKIEKKPAKKLRLRLCRSKQSNSEVLSDDIAGNEDSLSESLTLSVPHSRVPSPSPSNSSDDSAILEEPDEDMEQEIIEKKRRRKDILNKIGKRSKTSYNIHKISSFLDMTFWREPVQSDDFKKEKDSQDKDKIDQDDPYLVRGDAGSYYRCQWLEGKLYKKEKEVKMLMEKCADLNSELRRIKNCPIISSENKPEVRKSEVGKSDVRKTPVLSLRERNEDVTTQINTPPKNHRAARNVYEGLNLKHCRSKSRKPHLPPVRSANLDNQNGAVSGQLKEETAEIKQRPQPVDAMDVIFGEPECKQQ